MEIEKNEPFVGIDTKVLKTLTLMVLMNRAPFGCPEIESEGMGKLSDDVLVELKNVDNKTHILISCRRQDPICEEGGCFYCVPEKREKEENSQERHWWDYL